MSTSIQRDQVQSFDAGYINVLGYTTSAGTTNIINSTLSTAAQGAGYGGENLQHKLGSQNSHSESCGWLETKVPVYDTVTKTAFTDGNGNEVYATLTKPAVDYILSFFSLVDGTETAFSIEAGKVVDLQIAYMFDSHNKPNDLHIRQSAVVIGSDPSNNTKLYHENLTITALNTLSNLTYFPVSGTDVEIVIDGGAHVSTINGTISVSGKAITYNNDYNPATSSGFSLRTTSSAYARYTIKK